LAEETNRRLEDLLLGDNTWLEESIAHPAVRTINVGIEDEIEEKELNETNIWVKSWDCIKGIYHTNLLILKVATKW